MLRRVDAENRLQTLKEELDFQKNIYSEVGTAPSGRGPGTGDRGLGVTDTRAGAGGSAVCGAHLPASLALVGMGGGRGGGWGGHHPAPRLKWG